MIDRVYTLTSHQIKMKKREYKNKVFKDIINISN